MQTNIAGDRRGKTKGNASGSVVLWRPEVVLAGLVTRPDRRPAVTLAEPHQRPESVRARVDAARTTLASFAEKRELLTSRMTVAQERARGAQTERERVSATIDAYRLEVALDDVLAATSTQVSMLMKERGLR